MAETKLGRVTSEDLRRELRADGQEAADTATRRRALESLLVETALAQEARTIGLDHDPALALRLRERREERLLEAVDRRYVAGRVSVTPEAVEEGLRARAEELADAERIQLKHIFRRVPSAATAEERAAALHEMEDLLRQVRAGGSFEELARTRSDSETAKFEGRMAPVRRGQLDPGLEAIVWALEPEQTSDVVSTPLGFHIFKLERRIPARPLDPGAARKTVERSLRLQGEDAARKALFQELLGASGALYRPEGLATGDAAALLFQLGGRALTAGDLQARRDALPGQARHTRTLRDLLEDAVSRELRLWKAGVDRIAEEPDTALGLARDERRVLAQAAFERRLAERAKSVGEQDLRTLYEESPARFQDPERHRLSVIVARFGPGHSPHHYYEVVDRVAREVRTGARSFAEAARSSSDDPSAARGGDLGFVLLRDFGLWFGLTAYNKAAALAPGEMAGPVPFEVYDEAALVYQPRGYMLVRLEEVRAASPRSFEEARGDVAAAWLKAHPEAASAIQAEVLASLQPTVNESALAGQS